MEYALQIKKHINIGSFIPEERFYKMPAEYKTE